ncbi:MAG: hypothetical protein V4678_01010, partial [Patescibacteria group bacterium]
GLQHLKVYETTSSYLANLTPAGNLTPAVTFGANGNVFAIDSGARRYYSYATYQAYGQPEISSLAEGIDGQIPNGPALTDIVTQHNIGTIYVVSNSKKRHITRESYIADGYSNTYVSWMSGYFVNGMTQGPPVASAGTVLRTSDTNQYSVLKADRSTRQLIDPSLVGSLTMGSYSDTSGVINQIPIAQSSSAMKITAKDSSDNLYLVDGNTKLHLTSSQLTSIGKTAGEFVLADPSFLARLTTTSYTPQQLLTWIGNDGKVYRSEQGELVHIQSLADFNRLSYSFEQVARLSTNTATQLFSASNRSLLLSGTLFNVDGGARVYVSDRSNNIRAIPTSDLFATDLGLSWGSVRTINQQTFNHYSKSPDMTNIMTGPDGTHWMISLGVRYKLTQALLDEYDPAGLRNAEIDSVIINSSKQGKDASRFIRIGDDARVYYIDDGGKIPLGSVDAFSSRGGTDWNQVLSLSAQAASIFETSQTVY